MRLIDANKIEWYGCDFEGCQKCINVDGDCNKCPHANCDANQVRKLPTVNAIVIPDNATNGDMIKAIYPNAKTWEVTREDIHCAYIEFDDMYEIKSFSLSWWNSPYKRGE